MFTYRFFAYFVIPVKSIAMHFSSPTTHALWPGGTIPTSPGPNSSSVPSSMTTFILPEITYWVCGASQLFVFAIGLTHFSQLHPGSNSALPIVTSFKLAISTLPFSNALVSSGSLLRFFLMIFTIEFQFSDHLICIKFLSTAYNCPYHGTDPPQQVITF